MSAEVRRALLEMTQAGGLRSVAALTCEAVAGIGAVSLVLTAGEIAATPLCLSRSGELAGHAVALQLALGEGPDFTAHQMRRPLLVEDLSGSAVHADWTVFPGEALAHGIRASFAFPLLVHGQPVAVLTCYRSRPGPLSPDALLAAQVQVSAAGVLLLHDARLPGPFLDGLAVGDEVLPASVAVLHQAIGFLRAPGLCTVEEALATLRAYAFAHQRPLDEVADDVVNRRLTLHVKGASS
ncbi:GAF and ANTAR domain-containing protein [Streptomyces apricus]|uniref:GAF and ANTAR domain-containing protein n=1 Tax=Streptomyces apricus TaxID=1828112 RepID=UPI001CAA8749|nr:GAF and ANTAR domain-containing protein [Streptomyces apricus]